MTSTVTMRQLKYYKDRESKFTKAKLKEDGEIKQALINQYQKTIGEMLNTVNWWIGKFATQNGMTIQEARKLITSIDMKEYQEKAKKYVEDKDMTEKANEEMRIYNLNMRISRQELLIQELKLKVRDLGLAESKIMGTHLNKVAKAELERRAGILGLHLKDEEAIKKMLPSIVNGSHLGAPFSDRIWQNKRDLITYINTGLEKSMLRGLRPDVWANSLRGLVSDSVKNARYASERLAYTEASIIQEDINTESIKALGYESYVYIAEAGACHICKPHDGNIYKLKDLRMGLNAPSMHPNCRCTKAPHYDDEKLEEMIQEYENKNKDKNKSLKDLENKEINYQLADEKLADKLQIKTNNWFDNLTRNEQISLVDYTDTDFIRINKFLRNESLDDYVDEFNSLNDVENNINKNIKNIDTALLKYNLDEDVIFYRGVSPEEIEFYKNNNFIKEFKSLTTDKDVIANDFAEESEGSIVHFKVKKGTPGAYIGLQSYNSGEREFILARNQKFTAKEVDGILEVIIE